MKKKVYNPVSVYRLQFHKGFNFKDAEIIVTYLNSLGIRTVYASPIFQAVKGSMHGYDVTDPLSINSEIGNIDSFDQLIKELHDRNMGWLQDFVPNHMAYSTENPWIFDLLQRGKQSDFYSFFDIIGNHPDEELRDKIMLPFFGEAIDQVIKDGELVLEFDERGFTLNYFENQYPVSYRAYPGLAKLVSGIEMPGILKEIFQSTDHPDLSDEDLVKIYNSYKEIEDVYAFISKCISEVNSDPLKMKGLLGELAYIPTHWKITEKQINFRRFFTINSLICLNIQEERVFRTCHQFVKDLLEKKHFDGLRIDHIDGLADPSAYLEKLRKLSGDQAYIAVEKILEKGEKLPEKWPVQGSTGYDFLAMVNNLLTNEKHGDDLYAFYKEWIDESSETRDLLHEKKRFILYHRLNGELDILAHQCKQINSPVIQQIKSSHLKKAIAEFLIYCPVYRLYNIPSGFTGEDKKLVKTIFSQAIENNKNNKKALKRLYSLFLLSGTEEQELFIQVDDFFRRCMQFTGPLMAKGVEDTAFYSFNPFMAHNEVGDNPEYFGMTTAEFHELMEERFQKSPLALNTTATHDTKRGEDARARMIVLSDIPGRWRKITKHWKSINTALKPVIGSQPVPSSNDEYFIYQTLCAHLPMDGKIDKDFNSRLEQYLVKAFREAKVNSSWSEPDTEYENKTLEFTRRILTPESEFLESYQTFVEEIIPHGVINSLTQIILKNTVPGVPDTFQGSEVWNMSFVDPDNRRPVDYKSLAETLEFLIAEYSRDAAALADRLWQNSTNGSVKQWISYLTLQERANNPDLFLKGSYQALQVKGAFEKHIISFVRRYRDECLLLLLPLSTAALSEDHDWKDTRVILPDISPPEWENRFTKEVFQTSNKVYVKDIFTKIPFGMLRGVDPAPERKAGILLHVSSLPGKYGIGDFGPQAIQFVNFLHRTGQHYWQILPLTQADRLTAYSPYSSYSAFAGNTLFTDPVQLHEMGLLEASELKQFVKEGKDKVNYPWAEKAKEYFLEKAYLNYKKSDDSTLRKEIGKFEEKECYWLSDFALFLAIKRDVGYLPWNEWPEKYRGRDPAALENFTRKHKDEIEAIIFKQYIFSEQWFNLREYANDKGIRIFGDIPIYIDYDSADVWAHPEMFRLNIDKSMEAVAGVPPDYFNENGQLWGMPLFNWEAMKADGYSWWLNRIHKNLEWFDLLRLDHFRGFSAYWEVPSDSEVASNGRWIKGPANDLFDMVRREFPEMPFVAEDLGQIDQDVYDLRDNYNLPGMRVLQFGFGENMPYLQHTPLNFSVNSIAYTGTHDNNTVNGWFRKEADKAALKRIKQYTGKKLKEKNCHTEMIRLAYSSVARIAIIPMQDWLGLDDSSRMNFPSTTEGNWLWKLKEAHSEKKLEKKIRKMVRTFGRV